MKSIILILPTIYFDGMASKTNAIKKTKTSLLRSKLLIFRNRFLK